MELTRVIFRHRGWDIHKEIKIGLKGGQNHPAFEKI